MSDLKRLEISQHLLETFKFVLGWSEAYKKGWWALLCYRHKNRKSGMVMDMCLSPTQAIEINLKKLFDKEPYLVEEILYRVYYKCRQDGSDGYPIKYGIKGFSDSEASIFTSPKERWGDHPYADNVREFLSWCIRCLEIEVAFDVEVAYLNLVTKRTMKELHDS